MDSCGTIFRELNSAIASAFEGPLQRVVAPPSEAIMALVAIAGHLAKSCGVNFAYVVASVLPSMGIEKRDAIAAIETVYAAKRDGDVSRN